MKTGEVLYEKVFMSLLDLRERSHRNTNGRENWVQNMLNDQKSGSYQEVSNRTNQLQVQFVRDRGDLMCKIEETRPVLRRSMLILFAKNLVLQSERGDLLQDPFRENPLMRQVLSKHVHLKPERISMLNRHMSERGDLLSRMT